MMFFCPDPNSQASAASSGSSSSSSSNDVGATFWLVLVSFLVLLIVLIVLIILFASIHRRITKQQQKLSYEPSYYRDNSQYGHREFSQRANDSFVRDKLRPMTVGTTLHPCPNKLKQAPCS
jgi:hypothetical protein